MPLDRRSFLSTAAAAAAVGLTAPLARGATRTGPGTGGLGVLHLAGGADGLSLAAPLDDGALARLRPGLALRSGIAVDGSWAVSRRMPRLAQMLRAGRAVVFPFVGPPTPDCREHADAVSLLSVNLGLPVDGESPLAGWDTHAHEGPGDTGVLGSLATALDQRLADAPTGRTILAISEFGRNPAQSGLGGSDHGWAGIAIAVGPGARRLAARRGPVVGGRAALTPGGIAPEFTPKQVVDLLVR
jgi:uncharacterized protein (DUF1501 family)